MFKIKSISSSVLEGRFFSIKREILSSPEAEEW
jgi:hypothetical protein